MTSDITAFLVSCTVAEFRTIKAAVATLTRVGIPTDSAAVTVVRAMIERRQRSYDRRSA